MNRNQSRLLPALFVLLLSTLLPALVPQAGHAAEIVVNEVMARNTTNAPLVEFPEYTPDYVELYNTTASPIDLAAGLWSLSTKKSPSQIDPTDFYYFPSGTTIPAHDYLLVFFDNETNMPGIHTTWVVNVTNRETFTLSRTGDEVKLFKPVGGINTVQDSVAFGFQIENLTIGRVPDATGAFTLTTPTPAGGTAPYTTNTPAFFVPPPTSTNNVSLKINEWVAFATSGGLTNADWLEIYNPDTNIVQLSGLWVVDSSKEFNKPGNQLKALSFIGPQGWIQLFADSKGNDQNALDFSLSSTSGDEIHVYATNQTTEIDSVSFGPLPTPANVSRGRVPDGGDLIIRLQNASPEESNFGTIPEVVINEVLTHTDPPLEDAIELANVTGTAQNIGNWWLSNNRNNPKKYRIPSGTTIPPNGYIVFYEYQFNNSATAAQPFTLNSANGDECYLFKGDSSGNLTGFRRGISFGPAANGVSFIRQVVTNRYETNSDIVASSALSFGTTVTATDPSSYLAIFRTGGGAANPEPIIGPIVINEIHYHPTPLPGDVDDTITEFIELYNATDSSVPLYDPNQYFADNNYLPAPDGSNLVFGQRYADGRTNTWRLRGGVDFDFPESSSLESGKFALVVNFDPADPLFLGYFTNTFPSLAGKIPSQVQIYGPYKGKLSNKSATVELRRPDVPQGPLHPDFRLVPYITVDRIDYKDQDAWPLSADGFGQSAQRISSYEYGNNGAAWFGGVPTPGNFNSTSGFEPPSISRQPRSLNLTAGRTATFTVTARGGQLHYQWLTNDVPMADATNSSLSLINIATNQSAIFTVIITNVAGAITSAPAALVVSPPVNDTVPPTIAITSPSAASLVDEVVIVTGKATDKVGVAAVYYSINGGSFISATGSVTYAVWGTPFPVELEPGTNSVSAYSVDQAGNYSLTNSRSYFRSVRTPLTLTIHGGGTVKGAANGQELEIGRTFALTATPTAGNVFSNWIVLSNLTETLVSTASTLNYQLTSNTVVTANFVPNPFANVAGNYNGLFYDETNGVSHESSGFFTLKLTTSGTYSAKIMSGGYKLSAAGRLDLDGNAVNSTVARKGTNSLAFVWHVDLTGADTLTGSVSDGIWTAALAGDRAIFGKTNPSTNAGKYTFALPGLPHDEFVPGGASYGTVTIDSNGNIKLKGYLADKTGFAQKVPLSKNGQWPLYASLYGGKGSLLSWIAFTNRATDDFNGLLSWSKPADPKSAYYPAGFTTNEATIAGSVYTAPDRTTPILSLSNAVLALVGGDLPADSTNAVTVPAGSKALPVAPVPKLSLGFTLASGLFKGSYTPTNAGARAVTFAGAVLQKSTNGFGYFLGTTQSGTVSIYDPAQTASSLAPAPAETGQHILLNSPRHFSGDRIPLPPLPVSALTP